MFKKYKFQKKSFSQCGEDLIIDFALKQMKIYKPLYIDIGAHHPYYLSNTAYFYENGCTGICIEPDPTLYKEIKKYRKKDVCLNVGIGLSTEPSADFYLMQPSTLNTFSKEEALRYSESMIHPILKIIKLPLMDINDVIKKYMKTTPNLISLDIEGLDLAVLKKFDFNNYRPQVICVETITYTTDSSEKKVQEIIDFMITKGYFIYADTYINTIFIDTHSWITR